MSVRSSPGSPESGNPENDYKNISPEYFIDYLLSALFVEESENDKARLFRAAWNAPLHAPSIISQVVTKSIEEAIVFLEAVGQKGGASMKPFLENTRASARLQSMNPNNTEEAMRMKVDQKEGLPAGEERLVFGSDLGCLAKSVKHSAIKQEIIERVYFRVPNPSHALDVLRYLTFYLEQFTIDEDTFRKKITGFVKRYEDLMLSRGPVTDMDHTLLVPDKIW